MGDFSFPRVVMTFNLKDSFTLLYKVAEPWATVTLDFERSYPPIGITRIVALAVSYGVIGAHNRLTEAKYVICYRCTQSADGGEICRAALCELHMRHESEWPPRGVSYPIRDQGAI